MCPLAGVVNACIPTFFTNCVLRVGDNLLVCYDQKKTLKTIHNTLAYYQLSKKLADHSVTIPIPY